MKSASTMVPTPTRAAPRGARMLLALAAAALAAGCASAPDRYYTLAEPVAATIPGAAGAAGAAGPVPYGGVSSALIGHVLLRCHLAAPWWSPRTLLRLVSARADRAVARLTPTRPAWGERCRGARVGGSGRRHGGHRGLDRGVGRTAEQPVGRELRQLDQLAAAAELEGSGRQGTGTGRRRFTGMDGHQAHCGPLQHC